MRNAQKAHESLSDVFMIVDLLSSGEKLGQKYKDHQLKGKYESCRECHIKPDLLLIYEIFEGNNVILLERLGSHSDLFK